MSPTGAEPGRTRSMVHWGLGLPHGWQGLQQVGTACGPQPHQPPALLLTSALFSISHLLRIFMA